ncbi:MAG: lipid-A-disaccharide synthase [Bacteroidales bacterium]|nr:lipid-A-disaccharide synthase [Bacteroidales bacterium]
MNSKKYYIIAGEASGDLHGGNLITALRQKDSNAQFRFWGGDRMKEAAGENGTMVRHIRDLAIMGFIEVVSHLGTVLGNISFCKKDILAFNPDVVVFIDYPGFNLKIAKFTHQHGFRNIYYISPQIWAWKKGRLRPMRRDIDKLCYILPTEQKFYKPGVMPQAVYVGHPLLDEVERYHNSSNGNSRISNDSSQSKTVAILPGSRKMELGRMLPVMLKVAARHPEYNFVVAGMSLIGEEFYRKYIPRNASNIDIIFDRTYDILASSYAALVCSGTATLETALFKVPQVVCYQCNKLSAGIARILIGDSIKYISLVNLIADSPVVTELIQSDFNVDRLDAEFMKICGDSRKHIFDGYAEVDRLLGGKGASSRTAEIIASY